MATANESLRAINAHVQIASAREFRHVAQHTFGLCIQAAGDDPAPPGPSLTEPISLGKEPGVLPRESEVIPATSIAEQPDPRLFGATATYKVFFHDRECGDLTDAVTTDSFDAGVQLVRDRLPVQADYVVEATWTRGIGEMEVRSPRGTVVARVQPVDHTKVTVQPPVIKTGTALQVGDASPLEQLFAPMPQAA